MLLSPSDTLPANQEDEAPIILWLPVQNVDGTAHLNMSPWSSVESSVHPCPRSPHLHLPTFTSNLSIPYSHNA